MKFVWNSSRTGSVNLDKVRNFTISFTASGVDLVAWFNDKESFIMGKFKSVDEVTKFLDGIHSSGEKK